MPIIILKQCMNWQKNLAVMRTKREKCRLISVSGAKLVCDNLKGVNAFAKSNQNT